jgi:hypothetical protein
MKKRKVSEMNKIDIYYKIKFFLDAHQPKSLEDAVTLLKTRGFMNYEDDTCNGKWLDVCFDGDEEELRDLLNSSGKMFRCISANFTQLKIGKQSKRISPKEYRDIQNQTGNGKHFLRVFHQDAKWDKSPITMDHPTVSHEFFSLDKPSRFRPTGIVDQELQLEFTEHKEIA